MSDSLKDLINKFETTIDKDNLEKYKSNVIKLFCRKINKLGKKFKPDGKAFKPIFGAKQARKRTAQGFIYASCQNPANYEKLFEALPTSTRVPARPHIAFIYGNKFRKIKTKSNILYTLKSKYSYTPYYNDSTHYYYRSPKTGFIFGYDTITKKSKFVEMDYSALDEFLSHYNQDEIDYILSESLNEVLLNYIK